MDSNRLETVVAGRSRRPFPSASNGVEDGLAPGIIDALPGVFLLADPAGHLRRWNRSLEAATGYAAGEIGQSCLPELFCGEDRDRMARCMSQALETGSCETEAELEVRAGGGIPHHFTVSRAHLDEEPLLAVTGADLTRWRQREAELLRQASTDPLTGAANRRAVERELEREVRRGDRYERPFSLVMLDLDNFKAVNDRHGHETGDRVLQETVAVVSRWLREVDTLARWGGEELMVLAPETGVGGARELAERIRRAVEKHPFPVLGAGLTASFGVASFRPGEEASALIRRADRALYQAKETGRNRIQHGESWMWSCHLPPVSR